MTENHSMIDDVTVALCGLAWAGLCVEDTHEASDLIYDVRDALYD